MQATNKQIILYSLLALTLAATIYVYTQDQKDSNSLLPISEAHNHPVQRTNTIAAIQADASLVDRLPNQPNVDIFSAYKAPSKSENKPIEPPKPIVPATPKPIVATPTPVAPLPMAPAVPFHYIGKLWADDEYIVFVNYQGKNITIKKGDTIQQIYHIDEISPPVMKLTYLPLKTTQIFPIGEPN